MPNVFTQNAEHVLDVENRYKIYLSVWVMGFEWNEIQIDSNQIILAKLGIVQKKEACHKFASHRKRERRDSQ